MNTGKDLWYLTRGSGAVALLLLTASMMLGVLSAVRVKGARWPRFAVVGVHRSLTLLSIVFVVLHVVTTVADGYAPIGLKDAIVPFGSPYRPIWLGLGAVAFDLVLALAITSYLRYRLGFRVWRAVHWLAYASWPVALVHSLGTGSDARASWLFVLGVISLAAVVLAVALRLAAHRGPLQPRLAAAATLVVVPVALLLWYQQGPAQRGWAARAGTPTHLRASTTAQSRARMLVTAVTAPSFTTHFTGTFSRSLGGDGRTHVVVAVRLAGGPHGALRIELRGEPVDDGVSMDASGVAFVPATTRAVYYGSVTSLQGNLVGAKVRDAAGDTLGLTIALALDSQSGTASGTVAAVSPSGDRG